MEKKQTQEQKEWYERIERNIQTGSHLKRETPTGLWHKCRKCKSIIEYQDFVVNYYTCEECSYHERINSQEYFQILFDDNYALLFENIRSADPLTFKDKKKYSERITAALKKTPYSEAISVGIGTLAKKPVVLAVMNFSFIGGSMGSIVGERISKAVDYCIKNRCPLVIISKSGGARMMEAAFSLMQMAKTSAKLTLLEKERVPYISVLTDPTTGGVTASFAMLGDIILSEPEAPYWVCWTTCHKRNN